MGVEVVDPTNRWLISWQQSCADLDYLHMYRNAIALEAYHCGRWFVEPFVPEYWIDDVLAFWRSTFREDKHA